MVTDPRAFSSAGKRWRFRRDLAIAQLARDGWSQRMLSDVFDLARSRIATICGAMEGLYDAEKADRARADDAGDDRRGRGLLALRKTDRASGRRL